MKRFISILLVLMMIAVLPGMSAVAAADAPSEYVLEETSDETGRGAVDDGMEDEGTGRTPSGNEKADSLQSHQDEETQVEDDADILETRGVRNESESGPDRTATEATEEMSKPRGIARAAKNGGEDAGAHFHATITTNNETYTSGETALVSIKYTIDQESINPGDYVIVTIPPDIASKASFSVSKQHFSSVVDLGNGQYKLVFGENAATGLSGSMTIRVTTHADDETTDTISAGDGEKSITVVPAGAGETGVGVFADEAIMKDGLGNEGMDYGGYDYSQDEAAQIGLFDSSVDQDFSYRLFINRKNVAMTNVTVTDSLPDGMYFNGLDQVTCYKMDGATLSRTDEILSGASVSISGQTLTVYLGDIDYPVEIEYSVHVPAQTSVRLRNHSEVTYTQDGTTYKEHKDYVAQGNDYSASNGVKSVDKTIISDDPSDQWVTYMIKFWNENKFEAGEITLTDDLDDHVKFLYSEDNEYFDLTVDENDPTILHITNVKDIPASTEVYETFVCDFSGVPVGYTVLNTTGGNTTRTKKISGTASLKAKKTVDGSAPDAGETFNFRLMDQNHRVLQTAASDGDGIAAFKDLNYGKDDLGKTYTYYISEMIPAGDDTYIYDETEYSAKVTVGEAAGDDGVIPVSVTLTKDNAPVDEAVFNNEKPVVEKTSVSGSKNWEDADDQDGKRPESITVNLYADGTKVDSQTVTADDDWKWSFENLDKYSTGDLITYSIDEDPVSGYQSNVSGYNITNTYTPGKVSIPVRKVWEDSDNQDGIRPNDITVRLLANHTDTGKRLILNAGNKWSSSFDDLDEYASGKQISYSVEEVSIAGYSTEITGNAGDGFVITNRHTSEKTTVSGSKEWKDANDQDGKRPDSITVNLYADGVKTDSKIVTADDGWKWTFEGLDKNADGKQIVYSVDEDPVPEYQSTINRYDITNTYTPGKVSIPVRKVWEDSDDQDGIRPAEVVIVLLANGTETDKSIVLNSGNKWYGTFDGLDECSDGKKIEYSIKEEETSGYQVVINGSAEDGYTVTNSHTTEKTSVSGSKTWEDADDQDGKRPESITANLYADGSKVDSQTVTADDGWKWSFEDLEKYSAGERITYSIDEDPVSGYQSNVNTYNITNTYTPGKISIPVRKVWEDSDNQDKVRPDEITLILYADGEKTDKKLVLSEETKWKGCFEELDEFKDGKKIVYTITENEVPGYNCVISGSMEEGYTVTNSHSIEIIKKTEKPSLPGNPSAPAKHKTQALENPVTGDHSHVWLYFWIMTCSVAVLTISLHFYCVNVSS